MTAMQQKIIDRVEFCPTTGCWLWMGSINAGRYGRIGGPKHYVTTSAHRLSFHAFVGPIPEGMHVCHHCDNPLCVNPDHLFLGTAQANVSDCIRKGRRFYHHTPIGNGAKLAEKDVRDILATWYVGGVTQQDLADAYSVRRSTIGLIVTGKTWKHIPREETK